MFYSYENCPNEIKLQINLIIELCKKYIASNLIGVYLHGSLAMGCFNADKSDLDIIVVVKKKIPSNIKIQIIMELMKISLSPSQVEISFLIQDKLFIDHFPMHYDLHYSEFWRKVYQEKVTKAEAEIWTDESLIDIDLSAHIRIINERGITLFGKDKDLIFPKISDKHFLKAILCDFEDSFEGYVKKPEYYILNACRVLSFLENGSVMSKKEAGEWGIGEVPDKFRKIIKTALNVYSGKISGAEFENNAVKTFLNYIKAKTKQRIVNN